MKLLTLALLVCLSPLYALEFEVGSKVSVKVDKDKLSKALNQGKDNYEGVEIVVSKSVKIPLKIEKKWVLKVLSSENVPKKGDKRDDVIFVTKF